MTRIRIHTAKMETKPVGFIVKPIGLAVIYGTFITQDEAVSYAQNLDNAEVYPLYEPAIH